MKNKALIERDRLSRSQLLLLVGGVLYILILSSCGSADNDNANTTATTIVSPPGAQTLTAVPRRQKIVDLMKARGEQDEAKPTLRILSPAKNATIVGSTIEVKLELGGDLKGYKPGKDPATGMGNHIHVILDNQPYEAYYDLDQPIEFRNVSEGRHTLRVFPSRPWHESYKNDGAFQMVEFTVKGGPSKATAGASPEPSREGKDVSGSNAGNVDPAKPLLTYSRPKGEYKGDEADPIMIDFWLSNAKLQGDGGEYRVLYSIDGGATTFIDSWEPIWLSGWVNGKHSVKLELVDKDGYLADNGGYNLTTREITVVK